MKFYRKILLVSAVLLVIILSLSSNKIMKWRNEQRTAKQAWLYQKGVELFAEGDFSSAIEDLKEAAKLKPMEDTPLRILGKAYEAKGELDKAAESYEASLTINPNQPEALYNLAIILSSQGKTEEAINKLEEAVAFNKEFVAARLILGDLFSRQGDKDKAREEYQAVIDMNPFGVNLEPVKQKLEGLK